MRPYVLFGLLMALIVVASIAAVPGLSDRLRRWLIFAITLLVLLPGVIFLLFE